MLVITCKVGPPSWPSLPIVLFFNGVTTWGSLKNGRSYMGNRDYYPILIGALWLYTWNPNDLDFWRSTPQKKARTSNQNKIKQGSFGFQGSYRLFLRPPCGMIRSDSAWKQAAQYLALSLPWASCATTMAVEMASDSRAGTEGRCSGWKGKITPLKFI